MRLISTSKDKTVMYVYTDGTEGLTVDREKLITLLESLDSKTVTLSKHTVTPQISRTDLEPMDTLVIDAEDHKGFILAPVI